MERKEFDKLIADKVNSYPKNWRNGQKVFNAAEEVLWEATEFIHNIARAVQFEDHVDCFYDDNMIETFLNKCWDKLKKYGY